MAGSNSENPSRGAAFQRLAGEALSKHFGVHFEIDQGLLIGNPAKQHKFDLVSSDGRYVGEAKNYSWTVSDNVPSAKMAFTNEAVFYLLHLPATIKRFVVMRKDVSPKRGETLATYYLRTNRHLLGGIGLIEVDTADGVVAELAAPRA